MACSFWEDLIYEVFQQDIFSAAAVVVDDVWAQEDVTGRVSCK